MKISDEFKQALISLPEKEKDKLLLRLIKKDLMLANQLMFQLISTESAEELREKLEKKIIKLLELRSNEHFRAMDLLYKIKYLSGEINNHVSVCKDKYAEPYLNLIMLIHLLKNNKLKLLNTHFSECYKLNIYIIARIFKILGQIQALHEDLHIEFNELLDEFGELFSGFPNLMKTAIYNGFDVNWLIERNIPENIVVIQKELRANGFLK
jgi:hypothetical protein